MSLNQNRNVVAAGGKTFTYNSQNHLVGWPGCRERKVSSPLRMVAQVAS